MKWKEASTDNGRERRKAQREIYTIYIKYMKIKKGARTFFFILCRATQWWSSLRLLPLAIRWRFGCCHKSLLILRVLRNFSLVKYKNTIFNLVSFSTTTGTGIGTEAACDPPWMNEHCNMCGVACAVRVPLKMNASSSEHYLADARNFCVPFQRKDGIKKK